MRDIDRFRGCLIGGAVGDALGYAVEFWSETKIFSRYGRTGITDYELHDGKAIISDDTQMTLFTATGLLSGTTRGMTRGIMGEYPDYIRYSYLDWLKTQKVQSNAVYLSLGDKEARTRNPVMATVHDRICEVYAILNAQGVCSVLEWNPGNHFCDADLRTAKAFAWILHLKERKVK